MIARLLQLVPTRYLGQLEVDLQQQLYIFNALFPELAAISALENAAANSVTGAVGLLLRKVVK